MKSYRLIFGLGLLVSLIFSQVAGGQNSTAEFKATLLIP